MKYTVLTTLLLPSFLSFSLINISYASELEKTIEDAANQLINVEKSTIYDRTSYRNGSVGINETVKFIFDSNINYDEPRSYIVFSSSKPNQVSVFNEGYLASGTEVFSLSLWSQPISGLFFLENNGTIKGWGDWHNEDTMHIDANDIYIKNTGNILHESARMKRYDNNSLIGYSGNNFVLDNSGIFNSGTGNSNITTISASAANNMYVINRENGSLTGSFRAKKLFFKNEGSSKNISLSGLTLGGNTGKIDSLSIYGHNKLESLFTNTGIIDELSFSNATVDLTKGTVKTVNVNYGVTNIILGENTNVERIRGGKSYNSTDNDTLTLTEKNKLTIPVSDMDHLLVKPKADWEINSNTKFSQSITIQGHLTLDATNSISSVHTPKTTIEQSGSLATINGVTIVGTVENYGKFYVAQTPNDTEIKEAETHISSYVGGTGSSLLFNGVLAGDNSKFNRLIITGDASGESYIALNQVKQIGGYTQIGIPLVEIQGNNNLTLKLKERLAFGAYNYYLTNTSNHFYLNSSLRPESGTYLANLIAANQMFDLRFNEHFSGLLGDKLHQQGKQNGLWLKAQRRTTEFQDSTYSLDNKVRLSSLLIGADLISGNAANYRYNAGAMLGMGTAETQTFNSTTAYSATGKVKGTTLGAYAGFYADNPDNQGLYGETWVQWNRFNNDVPENATNKYRLSGFKVSAELGYIAKLVQWQEGGWFVQPQVQLLWNNIKGDNNHQNVTLKNEGEGIETHYGIKTFTKVGNIQPFFAIYQYHRNKPLAVTMENTQVSVADAHRRLELQAGIEGKLWQKLEWYFNLQQIKAKGSYKEKAFQGGLRYSF